MVGDGGEYCYGVLLGGVGAGGGQHAQQLDRLGFGQPQDAGADELALPERRGIGRLDSARLVQVEVGGPVHAWVVACGGE